MKNQITQFSLVVIAFVALTLIMSYTRPTAEESKQYVILVAVGGAAPSLSEKLAADVNTKISEGWRPQGGVTQCGGAMMQAMVK